MTTKAKSQPKKKGTASKKATPKRKPAAKKVTEVKSVTEVSSEVIAELEGEETTTSSTTTTTSTSSADAVNLSFFEHESKKKGVPTWVLIAIVVGVIALAAVLLF